MPSNMVPSPREPDGGDGDGTPSLDPSTSDILVQPLGGVATPTRRNRRSRDARHRSNPAAPGAAAANARTAVPTPRQLASRYGPSSSASVRRHLLSPAGGGRVLRRPVVERTLTRLCTLALPVISAGTWADDYDDGGADTNNEIPAAATEGAAGADASTDGEDDDPNIAEGEPTRTVERSASIGSSCRQRSASGMSAADAAAAAATAAAADESDDVQSISSRMSHATGTTAPVTNTGSSVANTTVAAPSVEQDQQDQQQLEKSFPPTRASFAPCPPQIVFGRYVAVATDDGRVCLFAVKSFQGNLDLSDHQSDENNKKTYNDDGNDDEDGEEEEDWDALKRMRERINSIEDERSAVGPVAMVGPFRVGGGLWVPNDADETVDAEADFPGCIVGLASTPAGVPLPTYRRRKKRRRPGDAEEDGDDTPPPPPPKAGHVFLGHIAALTAEGDVHVLQVYEESDDDETDSKRNSRPSMEVLASFSTMTFCATCICIRLGRGNAKGDDVAVPTMRVCVGHDNGVIGEWEIVITCDTPFANSVGSIRRPTLASSKDSSTPTCPEEKESVPTATVDVVSAAAGALGKIASANHHSRRRESVQSAAAGNESEDLIGSTEVTPPAPALKYSIPRPRLVWAGRLDAPIRSISSLGNVSVNAEGDEILSQFQQSHIAIGLTQRARPSHENPISPVSSSLPPASAIEVVDSLQAESEWQQARCRSTDVSSHSKGLDPVPLFDFCVWPGIGMEIRDGSMNPDLLNGGSSSEYKASRVDDAMVRGSCLGLDKSQGFALAVSDGSVAVSHVVKQSNGSAAWGIATSHNQIFLPAPPIGMGCFDNDVAAEEDQSLAYCLQGGLVFVVPSTDPNLSASSTPTTGGLPPQVVSYQCPCDVEGDEFIRFAHGFVGGNIVVSGWEASKADQKERLPIVGFSWAGGVMDVYRFGGVSS